MRTICPVVRCGHNSAKDQAKGAIGQPEVFLDNKAEEKTTKRLARGLGLKTYRMVDTPLRSSHPGGTCASMATEYR